MTDHSAFNGRAGFYGKVPARGDFIGRGLPPTLCAGWDGWLQDTMALGAASPHWADRFLTAPIWHLALGDAVLGIALRGLLVGSMDRVGRLFPFTILAPVQDGGNAGWTGEAEALALEALGEAFDPERLAASLERLGAPASLTGPRAATGTGALDPEAPWPAESIAADRSLWRSRGGPHVTAQQVCVTGLPEAARMVAMLAGCGL